MAVTKQILEGIKVVDFGQMVVGPLTAKWLADHGAQVVRIDSIGRPDALRLGHPARNGEIGPNRGGFYLKQNTNKYHVSINLTHPKGVELAKRLVAWADIATSGWRPGVIDKWGLGWDVLSKINPRLIMVLTSMRGLTGPSSSAAGFGDELQTLVGFPNYIGWPDEDPQPLTAAYTDFMVPPIGICSIVAALIKRLETGKGQLIDLCQCEVGLQYLGPEILDYTANKEPARLRGNQHDYAVPHNAYRCKGEDERWCVIAVLTDEQWQALVRVMGNPEWAQKSEFSSLLKRKEGEEELDNLIGSWTINYTPEELVNLLQTNGVPAGIVQSGKDLLEDPHVKQRGYFVTMNHTEFGEYRAESPTWKLSATPSQIVRPVPMLGEHNELVCTQFLGMNDEEFIDYLGSGALT